MKLQDIINCYSFLHLLIINIQLFIVVYDIQYYILIAFMAVHTLIIIIIRNKTNLIDVHFYQEPLVCLNIIVGLLWFNYKQPFGICSEIFYLIVHSIFRVYVEYHYHHYNHENTLLNQDNSVNQDYSVLA